MAYNPYNDARGKGHVVCTWGRVIDWGGLVSPSL